MPCANALIKFTAQRWVRHFYNIIPLLTLDPFGEIHTTNPVNRLRQGGRAKKDMAAARMTERAIPPFFCFFFALSSTREPVHRLQAILLTHVTAIIVLYCGLAGLHVNMKDFDSPSEN